MSPARQNPNAPDMMSIARGNEVNTTTAHDKSFSPDVSIWLPEPAMEYARAAPRAICRSDSAPNAVLAAVAAAPQPSCPASDSVVLSAAANHRRLRMLRPENADAIKIRVRSPL